MIGVEVGDAAGVLHCDALTIVMIVLGYVTARLLEDAAEVEGVLAVVGFDQAVVYCLLTSRPGLST